MNLCIKIELNNAAFEEPGELERILTDLGSRLPECAPFPEDSQAYSLHDANGNWVGEAKFTRCKWYIRNDTERGWWSNEDGWVGLLNDATAFDSPSQWAPLPDSRWVQAR